MKPTSPNAALYTVRELGKRAGASREFVAQWRVEFAEDTVSVLPVPGSRARIVLPWIPGKAKRRAQLCAKPPSFYFEDAPVLFEDQPVTGMPLFEARDEHGDVRCNGDLITSALWMLCREEEREPFQADTHGRFPAAASVAFKAGVLERPIVDEYGTALERVLGMLLPGWRPEPRELSAKITHDIDLTGLPQSPRTILGHALKRKMPGSFARDLLSLAGAKTAYLHGAYKAARLARAHGLTSAFYWQTAPHSRFDAGYDIREARTRLTIEDLHDAGCETGLHPGYFTFGDPARLERELAALRKVTGPVAGGRQHFLRWAPTTWQHWEAAGFAYDSSVGFADAIGFRAGTCVPYHPWIFEEDRESNLLEIPLIVMDSTPIQYMHLPATEAYDRICALIRRCAVAGGVFTLLWHNVSVIEQPYAALYEAILQRLKGAKDYDWRRDAPKWPLPAAALPA